MFALTLDLPTLPVKWAEGVSFKPVAGQNEAGILNSWGNLCAFTHHGPLEEVLVSGRNKQPLSLSNK